MSSSTQMLVALVLGAAVRIFFGEMVAWMDVSGNGVILLMQMTVFPYIVVSLVGGIGNEPLPIRRPKTRARRRNRIAVY